MSQPEIQPAPAGSGCRNPIIGGDGTLVYPQIRSPNFNLAGKTGWAILKNGNAYFFGLVTTIGSQLIFTNSNTFPGSAAYLFAIPAGSTSSQSTLFVVGPTDNPALQAILELVGESQDGTKLPFANLYAFNVTTQTVSGGVPFWLNNVAAVPAAAVTSGAGLLAFLGHLNYVSTADGNAYDTGRLTLAMTGPQTISSTGFTTLSGGGITLSKALKAGSYSFRAHLMYVGNGTGTAGNALFKMNSAAFSSGSCQLVATANGPLVSVRFDNASGFGGSLIGPALTTGDTTTRVNAVIEGQAVLTAAGTLNVQAAISGAGTSQFIMAAGSKLEIFPVVAT
jgi:hypothetical protein